MYGKIKEDHQHISSLAKIQEEQVFGSMGFSRLINSKKSTATGNILGNQSIGSWGSHADTRCPVSKDDLEKLDSRITYLKAEIHKYQSTFETKVKLSEKFSEVNQRIDELKNEIAKYDILEENIARIKYSMKAIKAMKKYYIKSTPV